MAFGGKKLTLVMGGVGGRRGRGRMEATTPPGLSKGGISPQKTRRVDGGEENGAKKEKAPKEKRRQKKKWREKSKRKLRGFGGFFGEIWGIFNVGG